MVEVKVRGAEDAPAGDSVTAFAEGPDLAMFVGTEKGAIYRIIDRVAEKLPLAGPTGAGRVTALLFESKSDLIAVYAEAGLFHVRPAENTIGEIPFGEIKGLKHLCCLVRDGAGHLWLGTNKGLIKYK
jgi:ligand-binding sensor domain-containing protein